MTLLTIWKKDTSWEPAAQTVEQLFSRRGPIAINVYPATSNGLRLAVQENW
jgi:hypothetical protein